MPANDDDVAAILTRVRQGESQRVVAKDLCLSRNQVQRILRGEVKTEVHPDLPRQDAKGNWALPKPSGKARRQATPRAEHERMVQRVLTRQQGESWMTLGKELGVSREWVRRIAYGMYLNDVLPELPRLDRELVGRSCRQCVQWNGQEDGCVCSLGIPECDGLSSATSCGAFLKSAVTA